MGEVDIKKVVLPEKSEHPLKTEKSGQFKSKIAYTFFYSPFLTLILTSFLLAFFLNNWLNFFVLYASLMIVYAIILFKNDSLGFWSVALLGIVYRVLPLLTSSVLLSNDIIQYGFFGTKILGGSIPYRNFDAPYPPLSLYATVPFVMLGDPRFLKAFFLACDIITVLIVYKVFLRGAENAKTISTLLLFFPVSLIEYSISGHNDSLAILFLVVSIILLNRSVIGSSLSMALAILSKIFPVILVPFLLKELYSKNRKSALLFLSTLLLVLFFVSLPFILISLNEYVSMIVGFTRYSVPYGALSSLFLYVFGDVAQNSVLFPYLFGIALLAVFCALVYTISSRRKWPLMKSCSVCLLILPFLLPQFQPWYLMWALSSVMVYFSNNLKLIRSYVILFLSVHVLYYLIFFFDQL